jgi:hypothetical protein
VRALTLPHDLPALYLVRYRRNSEEATKTAAFLSRGGAIKFAHARASYGNPVRVYQIQSDHLVAVLQFLPAVSDPWHNGADAECVGSREGSREGSPVEGLPVPPAEPPADPARFAPRAPADTP